MGQATCNTLSVARPSNGRHRLDSRSGGESARRPASASMPAVVDRAIVAPAPGRVSAAEARMSYPTLGECLSVEDRGQTFKAPGRGSSPRARRSRRREPVSLRGRSWGRRSGRTQTGGDGVELVPVMAVGVWPVGGAPRLGHRSDGQSISALGHWS